MLLIVYRSGTLNYVYRILYEIFCCKIKLLVLLFSQMWIPLAIVLLVSTNISSISILIMKSVRIAHSADLDTPANNKYFTPASRLYATHKVQCGHHIPDPLIGLSPEAFALNTEFDKTQSHTRHICSGLWSITLVLTENLGSYGSSSPLCLYKL